ncbi:ribonuclease H-like domain-containing protein [Tanacetum coccineum]
MDLFGPVSVRCINRKSYCLVVTDDFSRFSWVFFLDTKDETPEILKNFITGIENQSDHKVKAIRNDNGTEFKNRIMNEFYEMKGRKLALSFMRPFGCLVTILNTLDHLGTGPNWMFDIDTLPTPKNSKDEVADDAGKKNRVEDPAKEDDINGLGEATNTNSTNRLNTVSSPVNVVSLSFTTVDPGRARDQRNEFENVFGQDKDANSYYRMFTPISAAESSYENLGGSTPVNAATPFNVDYPTDSLMPDLEDTTDLQDTVTLTNKGEQITKIYQTAIFLFLSPMEPKKVIQSSGRFKYWVEACKRIAAVKTVEGYTQEEGINYDEVFALVARIEAIRLFLAYASFMRFIVYQMDVKSAFLYGTIEEEVYVCQPPGFENPQFPNKVYKVDKALYGLHQAPRACQDKYVADILKKFDFSSIKIASTPLETNKALIKDEEAEDVDQTIVANSTTEAEYGVAANCYGQNTATSKIVNLVKQIHAIVDGKAMVISKSSVRSDLLFNDENGIACLTNDEIFKNLALMGYEQLSTKLTFQKGKVTPLFDFMLVQNQAPEGEVSHELQTEAHIEQIIPSPSTYQRKQRKTQKHRRAKKVTELPQTSVPLNHGVDDAVYKEGEIGSGDSPRHQETIGGALTQTRSERVLEKPNEQPLPEGHTSGNREGSMEHTFKLMDTVPPTPHDSPLTGDSDFDVLDDDMEDVEGETVHTATTRVSAVSAPVTTAGVAISTVEPRTPPTTAATVFIDEDLTIAQTLIKMKEEKAKEKGVVIKDVEDSPRPIRSITILQPLPTIDPKNKGKGVLVDEEPEKPVIVKRRDQGLAQIESDAELAQRLHEEKLAKLDRAYKER